MKRLAGAVVVGLLVCGLVVLVGYSLAQVKRDENAQVECLSKAHASDYIVRKAGSDYVCFGMDASGKVRTAVSLEGYPSNARARSEVVVAGLIIGAFAGAVLYWTLTIAWIVMRTRRGRRSSRQAT